MTLNDPPTLFELRSRIDAANYRLERAKAEESRATDAVAAASEAVAVARLEYFRVLETMRTSTRLDGGK